MKEYTIEKNESWTTYIFKTQVLGIDEINFLLSRGKILSIITWEGEIRVSIF